MLSMQLHITQTTNYFHFKMPIHGSHASQIPSKEQTTEMAAHGFDTGKTSHLNIAHNIENTHTEYKIRKREHIPIYLFNMHENIFPLATFVVDYTFLFHFHRTHAVMRNFVRITTLYIYV